MHDVARVRDGDGLGDAPRDLEREDCRQPDNVCPSTNSMMMYGVSSAKRPRSSGRATR
jgi:hypothetical protein